MRREKSASLESGVGRVLLYLEGKEGRAMRHAETMEDVLRYIDEHISQGLTAEELARVSGYSFYHFCHLFAIDMGLSVGAYLRRRRLELAAGEILQGGSITEISTKSGFETPSGFSKAFRRHYGMAPTEYKSKKGEIDVMTPEIKYVEGFSAVGYCLAPPEGEFDVLDASAYCSERTFSSVSRADYAKLTYPGYAGDRRVDAPGSGGRRVLLLFWASSKGEKLYPRWYGAAGHPVGRICGISRSKRGVGGRSRGKCSQDLEIHFFGVV